jgi:hypothetical protein
MKLSRLRKLLLKAVLWLLGGVALAFISALVNSAFSGIRIWDSFKIVVSNIASFLTRPHSILFLLIAGAFLWIWILNKRVGNLMKQEPTIKEEEKELELNSEQILILKELANSLDPVLEKDLRNLYFTYHPDNEQKDFRFVINDLIKHKLMRHCASGPQGKEYSIQSKGLDSLRKATL